MKDETVRYWTLVYAWWVLLFLTEGNWWTWGLGLLLVHLVDRWYKDENQRSHVGI